MREVPYEGALHEGSLHEKDLNVKKNEPRVNASRLEMKDQKKRTVRNLPGGSFFYAKKCGKKGRGRLAFWHESSIIGWNGGFCIPA